MINELYAEIHLINYKALIKLLTVLWILIIQIKKGMARFCGRLESESSQRQIA